MVSAAPVFAAESALEAVVGVYSNRACSGCHMGQTARTSMAYFTDYSEHELMKSFAYRHYKMRDRVRKELGEKALELVRYLKDPTIDPKAPYAGASFAASLERDGGFATDEDKAKIKRWFDEGAPLPKDVEDEVFGEIRDYARVLK